ncbi:MAG: TVP38/TMEM64 family protein [Pirellulales bacterium]|nr:TVP38/TMEM64 family protein [Pirellulales bacterium]
MSNSTRSWPWRRMLIGAALLALLVALLVLPVQEPFTRFLAWVRDLGPWGPVILSAAYIPACVLALPSWPLTVGAGFLFGVPVGVVAVSIGSTLGATIAFLLGRTLFRDAVAARVLSGPKFAAIDRAVARSGLRIVFLMRLSPVFPYNVLNYALGVTRIPASRYILGSWLGMLPGTIMYVYLGTAAESLRELMSGEREDATVKYVLLAVGLAATILVTLVLAQIARRAIRQAIDEPAALATANIRANSAPHQDTAS